MGGEERKGEEKGGRGMGGGGEGVVWWEWRGGGGGGAEGGGGLTSAVGISRDKGDQDSVARSADHHEEPWQRPSFRV